MPGPGRDLCDVGRFPGAGSLEKNRDIFETIDYLKKHVAGARI